MQNMTVHFFCFVFFIFDALSLSVSLSLSLSVSLSLSLSGIIMKIQMYVCVIDPLKPSFV